jgi:hypothetical protein
MHVCKQSEGNDIRCGHAIPLRAWSVALRDYPLAFELPVSIPTPRTQTDEDGDELEMLRARLGMLPKFSLIKGIPEKHNCTLQPSSVLMRLRGPIPSRPRFSSSKSDNATMYFYWIQSWLI